MSANQAAEGQRIAIVSVYDKTGLLDLAKGLVQQNVRILASGGTAKMIRESGFLVEYEFLFSSASLAWAVADSLFCPGTSLPSLRPPKC